MNEDRHKTLGAKFQSIVLKNSKVGRGGGGGGGGFESLSAFEGTKKAWS